MLAGGGEPDALDSPPGARAGTNSESPPTTSSPASSGRWSSGTTSRTAGEPRGEALPSEPDLARRRTIFWAVVAAQDRGLTVAGARPLVAAKYGVTAERVWDIEREGLRKKWPPLGG